MRDNFRQLHHQPHHTDWFFRCRFTFVKCSGAERCGRFQVNKFELIPKRRYIVSLCICDLKMLSTIWLSYFVSILAFTASRQILTDHFWSLWHLEASADVDETLGMIPSFLFRSIEINSVIQGCRSVWREWLEWEWGGMSQGENLWVIFKHSAH